MARIKHDLRSLNSRADVDLGGRAPRDNPAF